MAEIDEIEKDIKDIEAAVDDNERKNPIGKVVRNVAKGIEKTLDTVDNFLKGKGVDVRKSFKRIKRVKPLRSARRGIRRLQGKHDLTSKNYAENIKVDEINADYLSRFDMFTTSGVEPPDDEDGEGKEGEDGDEQEGKASFFSKLKSFFGKEETWEDKQKAREKARKKEIAEEKRRLKRKKKKKKKSWFWGLLAKLGVGLIGSIWSLGKSMFGLLTPILGKIIGGFGKHLLSGMFRIAQWLTPNIVKGLGGLLGGLIKGLGRGALGLGGALLSGAKGLIVSGASKFAASAMGGKILTVGGAVLRGAATLLTGPVGWAIAIGTAAWAGYKLYKYVKDKYRMFPDTPPGLFTEIRMMTYGIGLDNKSNLPMILELEQIIGPLMTWNEAAQDVQFRNPNAEVYDRIVNCLEITDKDPDHRDRALAWLKERFIPAYREFLRTLWMVDKTKQPGTLDEVHTEDLGVMVNIYNPKVAWFDIEILPFRDQELTTVTFKDFSAKRSVLKDRLGVYDIRDINKSPEELEADIQKRNEALKEKNRNRAKGALSRKGTSAEILDRMPGGKLFQGGTLEERMKKMHGGIFDKDGKYGDVFGGGVKTPNAGEVYYEVGPNGEVREIRTNDEWYSGDGYSDGNLGGIDLDGINGIDVEAMRNAKAVEIHPIKEGYKFIVTSLFGPRNSKDPRVSSNHKGIDLTGDRGTPIVASGDGVVSISSWVKGFGEAVYIDHPDGYRTIYAHLDKRLINVGMPVGAGTIIGLMGSTGDGTGVHLHYEVREKREKSKGIDWVAIDPMTFPVIRNGHKGSVPPPKVVEAELPLQPNIEEPGGMKSAKISDSFFERSKDLGDIVSKPDANYFASAFNRAVNDGIYNTSTDGTGGMRSAGIGGASARNTSQWHNATIGDDGRYSSANFSDGEGGDASSVGALSLPDVFRKASAMTGVPEPFLWTFAKIESDLRTGVKNSKSSAAGLFQFINATWKSMIQKHGKKYGLDMRSASKLNPLHSTLMGAEYMKENMWIAKRHKQVNLSLGPALYLAHFLGPGGLEKAMNAYRKNPNTPCENVFSDSVIRANSSVMRGNSIRGLFAWATSRFNNRMKEDPRRLSGYLQHKKQFPNLYTDEGNINYMGDDTAFGEGTGGDVSSIGSTTTTTDTALDGGTDTGGTLNSGEVPSEDASNVTSGTVDSPGFDTSGSSFMGDQGSSGGGMVSSSMASDPIMPSETPEDSSVNVQVNNDDVVSALSETTQVLSEILKAIVGLDSGIADKLGGVINNNMKTMQSSSVGGGTGSFGVAKGALTGIDVTNKSRFRK